jgi:anti-sigma B factor antagonist
VSGDVDLSVAQQFGAMLDESVASAHSPLIVDMSNVPYIDSSGIACLVKAHNSISARGDFFGLVVSSPTTLKVFEILHLDAVFKVFRNVDAAVAAANG